MPTTCLFFCSVAIGVSMIIAAPEPKYLPPPLYTSVLVTEIDECAVKIREEGVYRLSALAQPSPRHFPPYCTVKLLAPVGYRTVLVFDTSGESVCASPSFIAVSDDATDVQPDAIYATEDLGVNFLESASPSANVVCGTAAAAAQESSSLRFASTTNLAEIVYNLQNNEHVIFSVKFVKEQLTCGEYIDVDHIDREITLTNNGQPGKCQVFLPGSSIIHIESIKLANRVDGDKCGDDAGSYFHLKTGNSFFFLPLVSDKLCGADIDYPPFELPCKRAIAELVSSSYELEEVKIRFTLASHSDSVLGSFICPP